MSGIDFDKLLSELGNVSFEHVVTNIGAGLALFQDQVNQLSAEQICKDCEVLGQQMHLPQLAEVLDLKARLINLSLIFAFADSQFVKDHIFKLQPAFENDDLPENWQDVDFVVDGTDVPCKYVRAPNERMIAPFLGGFYSQIAEYRDVIEKTFLDNGISCLIAQHPRCEGNWLDVYQAIPHNLIEKAQSILSYNRTPNLPTVWASHSAGCAMFEIDRRENEKLKDMIQHDLSGVLHIHPYFGPSGATKQYNPINRWIFNKHAESNSTRRYGHTWGDIIFQLANVNSIRKSGSLDKMTPLFPETLALTKHIETHLDHVKDMDDYDLSHLQHYYFVTAKNDHLVCSKVGKDVAEAAGAEIIPVEGGHTPTPEQLGTVIERICPQMIMAPQYKHPMRSHINLLQARPV